MRDLGKHRYCWLSDVTTKLHRATEGRELIDISAAPAQLSTLLDFHTKQRNQCDQDLENLATVPANKTFFVRGPGVCPCVTWRLAGVSFPPPPPFCVGCATEKQERGRKKGKQTRAGNGECKNRARTEEKLAEALCTQENERATSCSPLIFLSGR